MTIFLMEVQREAEVVLAYNPSDTLVCNWVVRRTVVDAAEVVYLRRSQDADTFGRLVDSVFEEFRSVTRWYLPPDEPHIRGHKGKHRGKTPWGACKWSRK